MGEYSYILTRDTRKLRVGDARHDAFLLRFAEKWSRRRDAETKATEARIDKAMAGWWRLRRLDMAAAHAELHNGGPAWENKAPYPRYVVQGAFEEGHSVYRNWPHTNYKGMDIPEVHVIDSPTDAIFAGFLRGTPGNFWLESWGNMVSTTSAADAASLRNLTQDIYAFMGDRAGFFLQHKTDLQEQKSTLRAYYQTPEIGTLLKMVMG